MSGDALAGKVPKLPEIDKEDLKAVRSFLPGKLLGRTAALLSLILLVLSFAIAISVSLRQFLNIELGPWTHAILIGPLLAVGTQVILEWRAEHNRRTLQALAVNPSTEQSGKYFRIGPYGDTVEDREKFSRPDRAEVKVFEWIKNSTQVPLYLTGDSGSGKSSLLNAFVLPELRAQGWRVLAVRGWQDPQGALRDALSGLLDAPPISAPDDRKLRDMIEEAAKGARLLVILDQFEEFVILAEPKVQQEFVAFVGDLQLRPIRNFTLLLALRSDYQILLEDIGLPSLRSGMNLLQLPRFQLSAANEFMKRSNLKLQPAALDRLLTSAAKLDDTPGLVRPITLNVVGYVLASGRPVAASLDAADLIRQYIEQTIGQPALRERAPLLLDKMITEQGTKQPRSERDIAELTTLRPGEVRAILNGLYDAGLARPLDRAMAVWELSHDFIAHAVSRALGRRRGEALRRVVAYTTPVLLVISILVAGSVNAAYLHERWRWFARVQPYLRTQVQPYVLTADAERALKPFESFRECMKDCPEMIALPTGEFMMGSPTSERGRNDNEGPQHRVVFSKAFAVSKFEVTFDDWDACVTYGDCQPVDDADWGHGRQPVINVSWNDAHLYAGWLSKMTGKRYRLLSEAEWEYAARGGSTMAYSWGGEVKRDNKAMANCMGCGSRWDDQQAASVGSFPANSFGLHDMHGNVWEWVEDCYVGNYNDARPDGSARIQGDCNLRMARSGGWGVGPEDIRAARRIVLPIRFRLYSVGFRLGRTLIP